MGWNGARVTETPPVRVGRGPDSLVQVVSTPRARSCLLSSEVSRSRSGTGIRASSSTCTVRAEPATCGDRTTKPSGPVSNRVSGPARTRTPASSSARVWARRIIGGPADRNEASGPNQPRKSSCDSADSPPKSTASRSTPRTSRITSSAALSGPSALPCAAAARSSSIQVRTAAWYSCGEANSRSTKGRASASRSRAGRSVRPSRSRSRASARRGPSWSTSLTRSGRLGRRGRRGRRASVPWSRSTRDRSRPAGTAARTCGSRAGRARGAAGSAPR